MRRPISEVRPQLQLSATISTIKPSCCCPTSASINRLEQALRTPARTFRLSQIPIAECAALSAHHPPRVRSLAAFGRRPPVDVARLSLAGIRNPAHIATFRGDAVIRSLSELRGHPASRAYQSLAPGGPRDQQAREQLVDRSDAKPCMTQPFTLSPQTALNVSCRAGVNRAARRCRRPIFPLAVALRLSR